MPSASNAITGHPQLYLLVPIIPFQVVQKMTKRFVSYFSIAVCKIVENSITE